MTMSFSGKVLRFTDSA